MPLPSLEAAVAVEAAESELLAAIVQATRDRRPETGAWFERVAGGCAGYAGPNAPMNKVAGLGFDGLPSTAELDRLEARYRERDCPVVVEVASCADPGLFELLGRRGYRLVAFEDVMGRELPADSATRADGVDVRVVGDDERDAWTTTIVDGFAAADREGVPSSEEFPRDVLTSIIRDMTEVASVRCYAAHLDGQLVAGGSVSFGGRVAHLCGAATLPRFRRRGIQTTLVGERLAAAAAVGCELAVTMTQPGSKSQQNMIRQGFSLMFVRAHLVLA